MGRTQSSGGPESSQVDVKLESSQVDVKLESSPEFESKPTQTVSTLLFDRVPKKICCIGAGYVGGLTAVVLALKSPHIQVTVVDRNTYTIRQWTSQHPPIHEPGLRGVLRIARDGIGAGDGANARSPNLFFSTDINQCILDAQIIFLCVDIPTKTSGTGAGAAPDLTALVQATKSIANAAKPGTIIVEKSTVPCGTAREIKEMLHRYRPGVPFDILSNPEFLAEGTAINDILHPDRVLIGSEQTPSGLAAAQVLKSIYAAWIDVSKIKTINIWSSELAKLATNAMLAQRVSSINSISAICEKAGANVDEVAVAIGQDSRLGPKFLKSGLGFGGSCFKKDLLSLIYLARSLGLDEVGDYWQQVLTMNEYQQSRFVDRAISTLNGTIEGRKIAILGYTFKKNTSDQRGSLAIDAIQRISAANPNQIVIFDPWCRPSKIELTSAFTATGPRLHSGIEVCRNAYAACKDACAVFILTDWDQFRYPPVALAQIVVPDGLHGLNAGPHEHLSEPVREQEHIYAATERVNWSVISGIMRKPKMVFDGRGIIDDVQKMEQLGFMVESVGKPSRVPVS